MKRVSFACCILVTVAACTEPATKIRAVPVLWMEWPAEVPVRTAFDVRVVVPMYCMDEWRFDPRPSADQSAITFEPHFAFSGPLCNTLVPLPPLDTVVRAPGLDPGTPRRYEMRGLYHSLREPLPVRTFGDVVVPPTLGADDRIMAAGFVGAYRDESGCPRIGRTERRKNSTEPSSSSVLENPPDTVNYQWSGFVRGYFRTVAEPVCGETRVFHLLTRD